MTPLIRAEWYKLRRSKLLGMILAGVAVQTVIQIVSSYVLREPSLGQNGVLMLADNSSLLCVWIAAFVGLFIASEFQNGTIRHSIALGRDRTHVFLSKVFSAAIGVTAIFAVVSGVATLGFGAAFSFGELAVGEFLRFLTWNFVMQLLYHFTFAAVFTMLAFLGKNPGMTVLLSIGYVIAILAIGAFLNNYPDGGLKYALEVFPQYYISEFGTISGDPVGITNGVIVSAAYIALALIIGCTVFNKSDIQ